MVKLEKKKVNKKVIQVIGVIVFIISVYIAGVFTTIGYNNFIVQIERQGVQKYKSVECEQFTDKKDKNVTWLECNL